jgi:hypothetical protein
MHSRDEALSIVPDAPQSHHQIVKVHGNVAITIGREGEARVLRVWIRDGDSWGLAAQQATRIQPGAPAIPPNPALLTTRIERTDEGDAMNADVVAALNALQVANALGDISDFARLTHPDFVLVTAHGLLRTKADRMLENRIAQLSDQPAQPLPERDDLRVRVYGATAIVTARSWPKTPDGGMGTPTRFLRVWLKGNAGWQQVANIVTAITAP